MASCWKPIVPICRYVAIRANVMSRLVSPGCARWWPSCGARAPPPSPDRARRMSGESSIFDLTTEAGSGIVGDRLRRANQRAALAFLAVYAGAGVIIRAPAAPFAGQSPSPTGWCYLATEAGSGIVGDRLRRANQRAALAFLAVYAGAGVIIRAPAAPFAGQSPSPTGWCYLATAAGSGIVGDRLCRANQRAALAGLGVTLILFCGERFRVEAFNRIGQRKYLDGLPVNAEGAKILFGTEYHQQLGTAFAI